MDTGCLKGAGRVIEVKNNRKVPQQDFDCSPPPPLIGWPFNSWGLTINWGSTSYNVNIWTIVKEDDIIGKLKFAFATSLSFLLKISLDFKEREQFEDMIDYCSYVHNLSSCEI